MTFVNSANKMDDFTRQLIQDSFIFSGIPLEAKVSICKGMQVVHVKQGRHLFETGENAQRFYLIQSGEICLYRFSPEGEEKVFQLLSSGDSIAEAVMFMRPSHYPVSAKAKVDSVVLSFSREVLLAFCEKNSEFAFHLLGAMATKLNQAVNRVDQLTLKNANQRLVSYLLELYQQQGSDWLKLPVAHSVLAGQLNIAPETLSRLFKKLKQKEVISGKGNVVVLLDIEAMCQLVNLPNPMEASLACSSQAWGGCCNLSGQWI
ncbi:Crp/Fnr family transcriptional regulator [Vibrio vulnificus]|uniref:Crp/Fnr family transcriptional regulator n=1 Tax=Vibrio vulnificus TaxID=672 RepID=UPI00188AD8BA|nr:Crp/Fnr family transcriptional regulator [Vibrio vulnificus]MBF4450807.1 Crp/Fnr family transcriptional regulator [Vibrio vulnificus]MBL6180898.1 Crp/Fnr family transcriptional regulator [Vibrio vulnificus]HDY7982352.1 Crp/Fnr family transcriptional regulator [Vibrio vulnificus]HDY8005911.1 Crp/Fnr family transcriptional regulator [Vibrio vulnificus]HDY8094515.1 Crp/Fnr family transcriptional regulator [Vibrio vulnificus]